MKTITSILGFILMMLLSQNSYAATIKCGTKSFSSTTRTAILQSDVLKACGKPAEQNGNDWVYKKKKRIVKFVDGKLQDIIIIKK